MSNGSPPITPAPVPPSTAGIAQPVIVAGGESLPPSLPEGDTEWISAGWGWLPPPQVGMGGDEPFPTPVVPAALSPPSVAGYPQPQYASGSATAPTAASLFPAFTTTPPSPPIVFANIFMNGAGNPPQTPSQTPPPIQLPQAA